MNTTTNANKSRNDNNKNNTAGFWDGAVAAFFEFLDRHVGIDQIPPTGWTG